MTTSCVSFLCLMVLGLGGKTTYSLRQIRNEPFQALTGAPLHGTLYPRGLYSNS